MSKVLRIDDEEGYIEYAVFCPEGSDPVLLSRETYPIDRGVPSAEPKMYTQPWSSDRGISYMHAERVMAFFKEQSQ